MKVDSVRITPLLRVITIAECFVLLTAGGGLIFAYDFIKTLWPWPQPPQVLPPYNAGFIAAIYTAGMIAPLAMLLFGRWTPARLVLTMLAGFTLVVLVASLINLNKLRLDHWGTWLWLFLYVLIPANSLYHLWLIRDIPPEGEETPRNWRIFLIAQGILVGLYGIGIFLIPGSEDAANPSILTKFWPWGINNLHAQMYCAAGVTAVAGAIALWRRSSPKDFFVLGSVQLAFGVLAVIMLFVASNSVPPERKVKLGELGTWFWLAAMAESAIAGAVMLIRWWRTRQT